MVPLILGKSELVEKSVVVVPVKAATTRFCIHTTTLFALRSIVMKVPSPLRQSRSDRGLTLVELLVVLVILIAVAGIASVSLNLNNIKVEGIDGERREPADVLTRATMREVSKALVGASVSEPGYRQTVGNLPSRLAALFANIDMEPAYDPATKRGWRGPYFDDVRAVYQDFVEAGDNFDDDHGAPYGEIDDRIVLDGWKKPLILQQSTTQDARLVSAGPNGVLETDPATPVDGDRGDDLVQFLFTTDPNL